MAKNRPARPIAIGQKFGKLAVCKHNTQTKRWVCVCDCGNQKEVASSHLGRSVNSCGCLKGENRRKREQQRGARYQDISGKYWASIKQAARIRKIPFLLSLEEAWEIWLRQNGKCALSGIDIVLAAGSSPTKMFLQTASLDRVDSKGTYCISNVQWVHKRINEMKNDDSDEEFIAWCQKVAKHRGNK